MKNLSKFGLAAALSFAALAAALAQGPNNGTYHIRSAIGRYLDVQWGNPNAGTPMHLWDFNGGVAQKWTLKKTTQGFYTIQSDLGRYLDVFNASNAPGTIVHLWDYNGSVAQQWHFTPVGDGSYYIHSAVGTYLDVQNANSAAGTPIWMYPFNGSVAQRWYLEPLLKQDKVVGRNLQAATAGAMDKTPGTIAVEIFEKDGKLMRETRSIRFRLSRNGAPYTDFSPQHVGGGLVKLKDIPPGGYTIQAYFIEGGGKYVGDSLDFTEEVLLSPDDQTVRVEAGGEVRVGFRVK
jgi:hypothetical protein